MRLSHIHSYYYSSPLEESDWILATGVWRDEGLWYDTAVWID